MCGVLLTRISKQRLSDSIDQLVCGLSDFEVTVNKEIIGLHNGTISLPSDKLSDAYHIVAGNTKYSYKALTGYKGLTLIKDQPIFIQADGTVDVIYGSEKLESISAGIDGSLWALQKSDSKDHQLIKWQTVTKKWYKINGAEGTCLSAYNEISVAIVDSKGLLSLSSQVGQQNEAQYIQSSVAHGLFPQSNILSNDDFKWLQTALNPVNFTGFEKCYDSETLTVDSDPLDIQCAGKDHLIFVQTSINANGSIGSIGGYVRDGKDLLKNPTQEFVHRNTSVVIDEKMSAILGFSSKKVIKQNYAEVPFYGDRGNEERLFFDYFHFGLAVHDTLYFIIDNIKNSYVSVQVASPDYEKFKALLDFQSEQNEDFTLYTESTKMEVFSGKI
ncbi:UNKNOWN [Stylonychia lemnae]|uniref:Uncharacterized protein n=1 Tax=Stylonychia lemnae TaxID=5949 RepID=A0A078B4W5_STYLE|nr:UNKNOWN [Stylonychia lemnae]|eukprot:CDW89570.1 UNKNOWN [Stylonychia lemnae]